MQSQEILDHKYHITYDKDGNQTCYKCGIQAVTLVDYMCDPCLSQVPQDKVNHPSYYNTGTIEPIDVIHDWDLGFNLGNALKYISRAGKKDVNTSNQDLEKAIWYIKDHISRTKEGKNG